MPDRAMLVPLMPLPLLWSHEEKREIHHELNMTAVGLISISRHTDRWLTRLGSALVVGIDIGVSREKKIR